MLPYYHDRGDAKSDSDEEDIGLMMDVGETSGDGSKDSVAEPLFSFLEELCELRGVSKWLRKTLISFVQITYGKTITRLGLAACGDCVLVYLSLGMLHSLQFVFVLDFRSADLLISIQSLTHVKKLNVFEYLFLSFIICLYIQFSGTYGKLFWVC